MVDKMSPAVAVSARPHTTTEETVQMNFIIICTKVAAPRDTQQRKRDAFAFPA